MAFTAKVTPGSTWPDGQNMTLAELRKSAKPTVSIEGQIAASDFADNSFPRTKIKHEDFFYGAESGTGADAIGITLAPAVLSLFNGLQVILKTGTANKGAAPTLAVNNLAAKKILKRNGGALVAKEILGNQIVHVTYNTSLESGAGAWELISPSSLQINEYAADTGAVNAFAVALSPIPVDYYSGMVVRFKATFANTVTNPTIAVNGMLAKNIKRFGGAALEVGDIAATQQVELIYDTTLAYFQLLSPPNQDSGRNYASDVGSTDAYAITLDPAPVAYFTGQVVRFKANTANTGAATLNVNALGAKPLKKSKDVDLADNDIKAGQIVEATYDGTNFQLLSPSKSSYESPALVAVPAVAGAVTAENHGLGGVPTSYRWVLVCNDAAGDVGYAQNDEVSAAECTVAISSASTNNAFVQWASSTQIGLRRLDFGTSIYLIHKTSGSVGVALDTTKWRLKAYASRLT